MYWVAHGCTSEAFSTTRALHTCELWRVQIGVLWFQLSGQSIGSSSKVPWVWLPMTMSWLPLSLIPSVMWNHAMYLVHCRVKTVTTTQEVPQYGDVCSLQKIWRNPRIVKETAPGLNLVRQVALWVRYYWYTNEWCNMTVPLALVTTSKGSVDSLDLVILFLPQLQLCWRTYNLDIVNIGVLKQFYILLLNVSIIFVDIVLRY